jgi:hypothetical protein
MEAGRRAGNVPINFAAGSLEIAYVFMKSVGS